MSVVNKMLRDLDQRAGSANGAAVADPQAAGTRSVPVAPARVGSAAPVVRTVWILGVALLVAAALVAPMAVRQLGAPAVPPAPPLVDALSAPPAMTSASQAAVGESKTEPVAQPASAVPVPPAPALGAALAALDAPMALRMDAHLSPHDARALRAQVTAPATANASRPVEAPTVAPHGPLAAPSVAPSAATSVASSIALPPARVARSFQDSEQVAQRQQQGGKEALAQAQLLWNGGNTDGALELMREAVARAERTGNANASAGQSSSALLVPLVQELCRMELALGHTAEAWDLLSRLEPRLAGQADLWALRGNAAQRLSRHEDSVHSYVEALQLRPEEQRWQLGLAVSLAALGRIGAAAEVADKARAMGPISRDVLAYLRQMGVPIKEK